MTNMARLFEQALLSVDRLEARRLVEVAAKGQTPLELVDHMIVPALTGGRICEELVDGILPPDDPRRKDQPPMAIAVLDDYHLLGKRIVHAVLRAGGFELKDYGRVTVDELVNKAKNDRISVLLISTLMLHSALHVRDVVEKIKIEGFGARVVVGGAPFRFDDHLWRDVGADAMGLSASDVPDIVQSIMGGRL